MAKPKHLSQQQRPESPHGSQESPIPEELKGVGNLSIRVESGKPSAYVFSMEIPATLTAIVRSEDAGGFSAEVPALPGCFTEGETLEELRDNIREAADGWLKAHQDLTSVNLFREASKEIEER